MKKSLLCLTVFLMALFGALSSNTARASHAAGGEISYKWLHDSTWFVYFKFYRDCGGISEPTSQTVCYANTCNSQQGSLTLNKLIGTLPASNGGSGTNGDEVNVGCPGYCTTCNSAPPGGCLNGTLLPGYREWWYGDSVTLPSRCNYWRFWTAVSARNTGVNNITTGQNLYVEATLNNMDANTSSTGLGPQTSAYFTIKPVPYVCVNQPYCYNMGAVDPDNDSLVFQMIQPRTASGACGTSPGESNVNFVSGVFNLNSNPFATGNSFTIDPATGQICFTPTQQQIANIAILVKEYRAGILIGTTMRDIQVIALPCQNQQPSSPKVNSTIVGGQPNNGRIEGCTGQLISFCFDVTSPDTAAVLVPKDNHIFATPGSTMTYAGFGTDSVRGCFSWTPGPFDTGLRQLTIVIKDSTCTPPGIPISQAFNIPLYIYPTATILKDTALCQGDSVKLLAIGGSQFTWSVLPGGSPLSTLSCTNCKNPVAKPTKTTNYVVTTNLQSVCNKNKDTVTITVPENPVFSAGPDTTTCVNSSLQLNINLVPKPGTVYTTNWTPATGLSATNITNPIASPKNDITYYVTVIPGGLNQCSKRDTLNVKVIRGFTIPNVDTAICNGQFVTVRGTGDTRYTYAWTALPAATAGISNPTTLTPILTPTFIGVTNYTVKASFPGCIDSVRQLKVDLQPPPTVTLPIDRILCYGDTAQLFSKVTPSYPGYIYTWTPGGLLSSNNTPSTIFSAQQTTNLTLKVTTTAGCNGEDKILLTVVPSNYLDGYVSHDTAICPGNSVKLRVGGPTVDTFVWRPSLYLNDTTAYQPITTPIVSTLYSVLAIDTNGCRDTATVFVDVKPQATIFLPDSVTLFPGDSVQFQPIANGSNALYYSWFPPQGLNAINIANPVATPLVNTRYHVTGTTEFGCSTQDSVDVYVSAFSQAGLPNAFTPGSGGQNGQFRVSREGLIGLTYFRIYNRWGTLVFETNKLNEGWDGTYKGESQPMGVYVYMFEAVMPGGKKMTQQGNVTLVR